MPCAAWWEAPVKDQPCKEDPILVHEVALSHLGPLFSIRAHAQVWGSTTHDLVGEHDARVAPYIVRQRRTPDGDDDFVDSAPSKGTTATDELATAAIQVQASLSLSLRSQSEASFRAPLALIR